MHDTGARRTPWSVQAEEKHGRPVPAHIQAAMGLDERRRGRADRVVSQYTRGLLSVEDLALELIDILGEVQ